MDFKKNIFIFIRDDKRGLEYGADAKRNNCNDNRDCRYKYFGISS